jgi:segregation and condensation protein A
MPGAVDALADSRAGEGATPLLSFDGYSGSLEDLLALARGQKIDLATIPVLDLVDQLTAAVRDAPAATSLAQKADWLVMAAWLVQLRARLLLPVDDPGHQAAKDAADRLRNRLSGLAEIQALAGWLDNRPLLGRDVFVRGQRPEGVDPAMETAPEIDVIEFLWVSMALFDDGSPRPDVSDAYRPPAREIYSIPEARTRILQRLSETPNGLPLEHLLPDEAMVEGLSALRKRGAWASTLIAGLELAKQGDVQLTQADLFTAVHVSSAQTEPPD